MNNGGNPDSLLCATQTHLPLFVCVGVLFVFLPVFILLFLWFLFNFSFSRCKQPVNDSLFVLHHLTLCAAFCFLLYTIHPQNKTIKKNIRSAPVILNQYFLGIINNNVGVKFMHARYKLRHNHDKWWLEQSEAWALSSWGLLWPQLKIWHLMFNMILHHCNGIFAFVVRSLYTVIMAWMSW